MIQVAQSHEQGQVVIAFSGALDARSAEQLASIALQQPATLHVVIDISRASSVHDSALGRLVDALPAARSHCIRGAGRHQARVLGYLGEKLDEESPANRMQETKG
jgi:anti-anti-sigma regulatory factor